MGLRRYDLMNHCWSNPKIAGALKAGGDTANLLVCGQTKLTNMPVKSIEKTLEKENYMKETSRKSTQMTFQTSTCSQEDFLASLLVLLESEGDLKIPEVHSFLKSQGLHRKNNHAFYCLKTSKAYYLTTKGERSELSSPRWMKLGMTANGKCLTLRTSECHRIGKECSLSDILEEQVDQKYFLSEKAAKRVTENWDYNVHDRLPGA